MPEQEKEALRFSAERLHGSSGTFERDALELLRVLNTKRIREKLVDATRSLEQKSEGGGEKERKRLEGEVRLYTEQLAQLHQRP